eukprot:2583618-Pleurochrysis_carterae.AAC.1
MRSLPNGVVVRVLINTSNFQTLSFCCTCCSSLKACYTSSATVCVSLGAPCLNDSISLSNERTLKWIGHGPEQAMHAFLSLSAHFPSRPLAVIFDFCGSLQ